MMPQQCCLGHTLAEASFCPSQQSELLLQIASCSVHYSGALLLEARDGEFLDEHLCSSSTAASTQTQQPQQLADDQFTAGNEAADAAHGSEHAADAYDDDGGGCDDGLAGGDYMQEDAAQGLQGLASGFRPLTCTRMLHRQMSMLSCVFQWLQKLLVLLLFCAVVTSNSLGF